MSAFGTVVRHGRYRARPDVRLPDISGTRSRSPLAKPDVDERAVRLPLADFEDSTQSLGPFAHDLQPEAVVPLVAQAAAVVLDSQMRERRVDAAGDPQMLCPGVLSRVRDGLLRDSQQFGL